MDGIAPGEDAAELAIALGHQHRPDPVVAHVPARLFDRSMRRQRNGILVPDDIRHFPHGEKPVTELDL
jgi:hypothetical protein